MPRNVRSSSLETRAGRLRLPIARKPRFVKVAAGIGLGYRRNHTAGTWVVRVADGRGANWTKAIGVADDFGEADGVAVLDYWQAQTLRSICVISLPARFAPTAAKLSLIHEFAGLHLR